MTRSQMVGLSQFYDCDAVQRDGSGASHVTQSRHIFRLI